VITVLFIWIVQMSESEWNSILYFNDFAGSCLLSSYTKMKMMEFLTRRLLGKRKQQRKSFSTFLYK